MTSWKLYAFSFWCDCGFRFYRYPSLFASKLRCWRLRCVLQWRRWPMIHWLSTSLAMNYKIQFFGSKPFIFYGPSHLCATNVGYTHACFYSVGIFNRDNSGEKKKNSLSEKWRPEMLGHIKSQRGKIFVPPPSSTYIRKTIFYYQT